MSHKLHAEPAGSNANFRETGKKEKNSNDVAEIKKFGSGSIISLLLKVFECLAHFWYFSKKKKKLLLLLPSWYTCVGMRDANRVQYTVVTDGYR